MSCFTVTVLCFLFCFSLTPTSGLNTYNNESRLFKDKLGPNSDYNTNIRPVIDQYDTVRVNVTFHAMAIVEIDAIKQLFVLNGYLGALWTDQILRWNPDDYGGTKVIYPQSDQIWTPRMIVSNTLGDRDPFHDQQSPTFVRHDGTAGWYPGGLFHTSCKLDLYKFPYDAQDCYIDLMINGRPLVEVSFEPTEPEVGMEHYVRSGEWTLEKTSIQPENTARNSGSSFKVHFYLRRRPGYFVINIVTPVVLLSFLNILVFLIPGESGEKISYGITVLLAVSVFMGAVSGHLPRSSDTLPLVTIYLVALLSISVGTVVVSILTVWLSHKEEKGTKHDSATSDFKSILKMAATLNEMTSASAIKDTANSGITKNQVSTLNYSNDSPNKMSAGDKSQMIRNMMGEWKETPLTGCDARINRWRRIGKHINLISFLVFMIIWLLITVGFLMVISS